LALAVTSGFPVPVYTENGSHRSLAKIQKNLYILNFQ